ncbi:MAG: signal recognition particle protein Srp54, partial [Holosporales bacterium]|nr:signal recognition particle protein Srp54 [Holosporales bacterium]
MHRIIYHVSHEVSIGTVVFANLSKKLLAAIGSIGKRGILTDEAVDAAVREIRISLLEADVALDVVKSFTSNVREKLIGQKLIGGLTSEQTIIKIVYDELVELLGTPDSSPGIKHRIVLMVGLQGTGKTTTSAKLAYLQKTKFKKRVLLVSLDTYRPAAIHQLQKLASQNSIDFFDGFDIESDDPIAIVQKSAKARSDYDITIYDTAGRLYIDDNMMTEVKTIKELIGECETFLVVDSMMGQDSINMARSFNEAVGLTGIVLTRIDGDARGGVALSAKAVSNCQIRYIGTGEKIQDIEVFHPDRIASRILDRGDMMSLIENAMDENVVDAVKDVAIGKKFDLAGMETYLGQLEKIGGLRGFMKFLPGVGKLKAKLEEANITDRSAARQRAIIRSMTPLERRKPEILNASRRRRIAAGCGQQVSDVNKLIK